jgi:REP element-mobilizing transposase RayT
MALAASRHGIEVHAYCVLSNHYHLVITDPDARLPAFQQLLNALVARAINALQGSWETFWSPSSYSAVAIGSARDIVDKTAYVLANPVLAGLVGSGRQWPGLWSAPSTMGGRIRVRRPRHFFDPEGALPESIELELTVPPGFPTASAFREELEPVLREVEATAVRKSAGFLGAARLQAQRPFDRPRTREPRRGLIPRVAARDKWKRCEMLGRLKGFLAAYREALETWRAGREEPVFPAGTYLMRVAHGVACAGAG